MTKPGQRVVAHYRGTLDDGTEFDNSYSRGEPIEFIVGVGQMIPGFDEAVLSMEPGDIKKVHIPYAEAYGEYRLEMLQTLPLDIIPNSDQLPLGEYIMMPTDRGDMMKCKVLYMSDTEVTFDLNHEMAGRNLNFEIELVSVTD